MEKRTIPIIILAIFSITIIINSQTLIPVFADEIIHYSLTTSDSVSNLSSFGSHFQFMVQFIDESASILNNKQANNVELKLFKLGSPTGTITVGVWNQNSISGAPVYTFGTRLAQDLTTTATFYNFTNLASSIVLTNSHVVGIHFAGGGSTNTVRVNWLNSDSIDGDNSCRSASTGGDLSTLDCAGGGFQNDLTAIISLTDGEGGSGSSAFCDQPENENILSCRLGGDGTLGSAGSYVIGNTTDGTGLLGIGCGIGIVDCVTDDNPQTNGLGLLIFIASIFVVVGMFVTTQGIENTIKLPVYMWAILIIALSAFFTITEIIDPVFLIISIIGLIALGAPKLVGMFRGGNTFGSGSTE